MLRRLTQVTDLESGIVVTEEYREDRRLHRDSNEGPAVIERTCLTGEVYEERYYWRGRLHRPNGPAKIEYKGKVLVNEDYYKHGLNHRDPKEGPAWIERTDDGTVVITEAYYVNGRLYRDPADGPCSIARTNAGEVESESYCDPSDARPTRSKRGSPVQITAKKPSP